MAVGSWIPSSGLPALYPGSLQHPCFWRWEKQREDAGGLVQCDSPLGRSERSKASGMCPQLSSLPPSPLALSFPHSTALGTLLLRKCLAQIKLSHLGTRWIKSHCQPQGRNQVGPWGSCNQEMKRCASLHKTRLPGGVWAGGGEKGSLRTEGPGAQLPWELQVLWDLVT